MQETDGAVTGFSQLGQFERHATSRAGGMDNLMWMDADLDEG